MLNSVVRTKPSLGVTIHPPRPSETRGGELVTNNISSAIMKPLSSVATARILYLLLSCKTCLPLGITRFGLSITVRMFSSRLVTLTQSFPPEVLRMNSTQLYLKILWQRRPEQVVFKVNRWFALTLALQFEVQL